MSYRFTEDADSSLSSFSQEITEKLIHRIDEAKQKGFYNNDDYSYFYDHHGRPWDKLDFKEGALNHRVFFARLDQEFAILEIFERDEIEYDRHELYSILRDVDKKINEK